MDPVTHGLLGGAAAQTISKHPRMAAAVGLVTAPLADLDILIRSSDDPLLSLEYHRQFTHALVFIPLGALIGALLLWPFVRKQTTPGRLYGLTLAAYATAGLLDACTSYGTHLLWPFTGNPVAWNLIAVVDPVFTLSLLCGVAAACYWRRSGWARIGLAVALAYLALGAVQHHRALAVAEDLALARNLHPERLIVKPTMANLVLWRSVTVADGNAYADAIRVGLPGNTRVYQGESTQLVEPDRWGGLPEGSRAYRDLHRFHRFADGFLAVHPNDRNFVGDLRYALLPTSVAPLWGVVVDRNNPDRAVDFVTKRKLTPAKRQDFVRMLRGRSPGTGHENPGAGR